MTLALVGLCFSSLAFVRTWQGIPVAALVAVLVMTAGWTRPHLDRATLIFVTIGMTYVALSYAHVLPLSWAPIRLSSYIIRQAHYVVLFPILFVCFRGLIRALAKHEINPFPFLLLCAGISWTAAIVFRTSLAPGFRFIPYGFDNTGLLLYLCTFILLYSRPLVFSLVFAALAATSAAAQNTIVCLLLLGTRWIGGYRITALGAMLLPLVPLFLVPFFEPLYRLDPNTGVRISFIRDALDALGDTLGFGIGFGTWGVRNYYPHMAGVFIDAASRTQNVFLISSHNSVFGLMLRMGVAVGLLYGAIVISYYRATKGLSNRECTLAVGLLILTFAPLAVNVAIESPTYSTGVAFALALVDCYLRDYRVRTLINKITESQMAKKMEQQLQRSTTRPENSLARYISEPSIPRVGGEAG